MMGDRISRRRAAASLGLAMLVASMPGAGGARTEATTPELRSTTPATGAAHERIERARASEPATKQPITGRSVRPSSPSRAAHPIAVQEIDVRYLSRDGFGITGPQGLTYLPGSRMLVVSERRAGRTVLTGVRTWGDEVGRRTVADNFGPALAPHPAKNRLTAFRGSRMLSIRESGLLRRADVTSRPAATGVARPMGATSGPKDTWYILDGATKQVVAVPADGGALDATARVSLARGKDPRGLAFNHADGLLYTADGWRVHAFKPNGRGARTYDLRGVGIQDARGIAVAPSADATDDASLMSLYVLDGDGDIVEVRQPLISQEGPSGSRGEGRTMSSKAGSVSATLVKTVNINNPPAGVPPSADSAGVAYDPDGDQLVISDSEINEPNMSHVYQGVNLFHYRRNGTYIGGGSTDAPNPKAFSPEPTGAGMMTDGTLLIVDDDKDDVSFVKKGSDGIYGTADDTVTEFVSSNSGGGMREIAAPFADVGDSAGFDPEGIAYDATNNAILVIDGVNNEVWRWTPGPDGQFSGKNSTTSAKGDDVFTHFDTKKDGNLDPEGIVHNPALDTIEVLSHKSKIIYQYDVNGNLLGTVDVSATNAVNAAGLELSVSSYDPAQKSYWIVDRGIDNDSATPQPVDGKLYELSTGGLTNLAPTVTIVSPADGGQVAANTPVLFKATANDTEDGDVTNSVTWTSPGMVGTPSCSTTATPPIERHCNLTLQPGVQTVTARATDSKFFEGFKSIQLYVGNGPFSVEIPLIAGTDDAEEALGSGGSPGSVRLDSDLEIGVDGSKTQVVGFRFPNVLIPKGVFVDSAFVQFTADGNTSGPASFRIHAQDAGNPPTFASGTGNISTRPKGAKFVDWSPPAWTGGQSGPATRSPELWPLLDPLFSRSDWAKGNAIVLIVSPNGANPGTRRALAREDGGGTVLHINFQFTPPPPVVTITKPANLASLPIGKAVAFEATALTRTGNMSSQLTWSSDKDGVLNDGNPAASFAQVLSENQHKITASVTDGNGQTGTATANIVVENQKPVLRIDSPADGSGHPVNGNITFVATGHDPEDGNLAYLLTWHSSRDGNFGRGGMVTRKMSVGTHIITVSATDRRGLVGQAQITITVASLPPTVSIATPNDTSTFNTGTKITMGGRASDPEEGNLSDQIRWVSDVDGSLGKGGTTTSVLSDGTHTITASVTDSTGKKASAAVKVIVKEAVTVAAIPLASARDDAEEFVTGEVRTTSGELNMSVDQGRTQIVGLRYQLPVPKGATITSAYVQFTAHSSSAELTTLVIECQNVDDAPAFSESKRFDISSRAGSTQFQLWDPQPWTAGEAGEAQRTPELKHMIQRVIDRPGWRPGNMVALIITGNGSRTASAFERGTGPVLHVDWDLPKA